MVKTLGHVDGILDVETRSARSTCSRGLASPISISGLSTVKRMAGETARGRKPDPRDKRFADPEWSTNQFFDFLKQVYLSRPTGPTSW